MLFPVGKILEGILFLSGLVRVMVKVFKATIKNISIISWPSVLLVEEIRVPRENRQPAASHGQTLSHNVVSSTLCLSGFPAHNISGDRH